VFRKVKHVHFIGIAGIGMAGIAEVLLNLGFKVSGSDIRETETTRRLKEMGAQISYEHKPENISEPDVCVYSSAIPENNVEIQESRKRFIPIIPRGEMLAELMRLKQGIVVAGSHGKTTIASMIGSILIKAGLDPTIILGGRLSTFGSGAKLGEGELFVAEIDESDGSFLKVSPTIAIVASIDREHINFYGSMESMKEAFIRFANKVPFYGTIVFNLDDKNIQEILPHFEKRPIPYGLSQQAEVRGTELAFEGFTSRFVLIDRDRKIGEIKLHLPGIYNVRNALAAWAAADELDIAPDIIKSALEGFVAPDRRFQLRGKFGELLVVEDYAHHPTAIKSVLSAIKIGFSKRIIAVCQPHRYTRVNELFSEFTTSFYDADVVVMAEIYSAGEPKIPNITGEILASEMAKHGHHNVIYLPEVSMIPHKLIEIIEGNELVIFLGAGDIYKAINKFIELMSSSIKQG